MLLLWTTLYSLVPHDLLNLNHLFLITALEISQYHSYVPWFTMFLLAQSISTPHIANDKNLLKDALRIGPYFPRWPDLVGRRKKKNLHTSMQSALNLPQQNSLSWQQETCVCERVCCISFSNDFKIKEMVDKLAENHVLCSLFFPLSATLISFRKLTYM